MISVAMMLLFSSLNLACVMPLRTAADPVGDGCAVRGVLVATVTVGGRCLKVAGDGGSGAGGGAGTGRVVDFSDCPQLWQKWALPSVAVPQCVQYML